MTTEDKRVLLAKQFAWTYTKKDAKFSIFFGPHAFNLTDENTPVTQDHENPERVKLVDKHSKAIQDFVVLGPGEYAIIHNPTTQRSDEYPNGSYQVGQSTEMPDLLYGQKRVVVSGHFPMWPYQKVEIRRVHGLSTDQYLMAVVEEAEIDRSAPFFSLLCKCAAIKTAVVDDSVESVDQGGRELPRTEEIRESTDIPSDPGGYPGDELAESAEDEGFGFVLGQRIVIPGSLTPTFIPPTGVELVTDDEVALRSDRVSSAPSFDFNLFRGRLSRNVSTGVYSIDDILKELGDAGFGGILESVRSAYSYFYRDEEYSKEESIESALERHLTPQSRRTVVVERDLKSSSTDTDRFIRQAIVLGPIDFCRIVNEDGEPTNHRGPGRIFPGPNDRIETRGSDNRIYNAYHLRADRGILLRIIAEAISKEDLSQQLPEGCDNQFEKPMFFKGDEIFISEVDAYLVPSKSFEVTDPRTREPHLGNNHSKVFVEAVGVDQESGVYVANVDTGNVATIRGEKKLLLDPRKQTHQERRVPGILWNLMIGEHEPHKKVDSSKMIETPWALSVVVPNNEAVLVTGGKERRVVEGPCIELLGYRETLEVLKLSRGRPKEEDEVLRTCFLRVTGNRVTDKVTLTAADDQDIEVEVYYDLEFVAESDEEKLRWFDHKNYVWLLCSNLRSRMQAAARRLSIEELYSKTAEFVRDTILGVKGEGDEHRPGFCENNIKISEVDVLGISVPDGEISSLLRETNHSIVVQQLRDRAEQAKLESARRQSRMKKELAELEEETARVEAGSRVIKKRIGSEVDAELGELDKEGAERDAAFAIEKEKFGRQVSSAKAEIALEEERQQAEIKGAVQGFENERDKFREEHGTAIAELKKRGEATIAGIQREIEESTVELWAKRTAAEAEGKSQLLQPELEAARQRVEAFVAETTAQSDGLAKINAAMSAELAADVRLLAEAKLTVNAAEALGPALAFRDGVSVEQFLTQVTGSPLVQSALRGVGERFQDLLKSSPPERSKPLPAQVEVNLTGASDLLPERRDE